MKRRDALAAIGSLALGGMAVSAESVEKQVAGPVKPGERVLLRLNSSARIKGSYSRELADVVEASWKEKYPGGRVLVRDFARSSVAHVHGDAMDGFYNEPGKFTASTKKALTFSDMLIRELLSANDLLLAVPIYNFTVPSTLKAWIDQVMRPGYAFTYTQDGQLKTLLDGRRAYVAIASGFEYTGTELAAYDMLKPYLQAILGYVGISDIKFVSVEGTVLGDVEKLAKNTQKAHAAARQLVT